MGNSPTHLSDCAVALEAAVRELSRRYPPSRVPKHYPMSTTSTDVYIIWEEDVRERMFHHASYGRHKELQAAAYRSGIPTEEIVAVITLIYG